MRVYDAKMVYSLVSLGEVVEIETPSHIGEYIASAFEECPVQEAFYCLYLDRRNHPIGRQLISLGTATSTLVSPREVFRGAIVAGAVALCVAHNHPSGDPAPSGADLRVTRMLRDAARILEIVLIDHVIVGDPKADPAGRGYYSFREAGLL
ncbi:MAG TPA: JAB domain-containing protein [Opitutaceae bacterium]|nr:JAB domain-containing protein [Opitutaceae bacterium]HLP98259.1 JAB domain-containing protein [Sideroxyarcus sp.]